MEPNVQSPNPAPQSAKTLLIVILILAVLGAVATFAYFRSTPPGSDQDQDQEEERADEQVNESFRPLAPNTVIYGTWFDKKSVIKAFDLTSGTKTVLARLPDEIKKVQVVSADKLLYIGKTDQRDHGKELAIYSIPDKKSTVIYKADNGFGIDDYVLSPDHRYVAVWEVKFPDGAGYLSGGSSRVYAAQVSQGGSKNRIYDEVQVGETPIHYPRAILNSGDVYTDTFLPNSNAGWAYGMSVSNFSGTQKQDIAGMQNGTYGTQPALSPDGRYLAFAGYDGAFGPGTGLVNGFRRALVRSDNVSLLDTQTRSIQKLPNLSTANVYGSVKWDSVSGKLIYTVISSTPGVMGIYAYDMASKQAVKLDLGDAEDAQPSNMLASFLGNGSLLVGGLDTSESALGNLGDMYGAPYTDFAVIAQPSGTSTGESIIPVDIQDSHMQLIGIVTSSYLKGSSDIGASSLIAAGSNKGGKDNKNNGNKKPEDIETPCDKASPQLCTFYLKPSLAPVREEQQSDPRPQPSPPSQPGLPVPPSVPNQPECKDVALQKCSSVPTDNQQQSQCIGQQYLQQKSANACDDSPLYLYGIPGQQVSVKVNTLVFADTPVYNDGYAITLLEGDKLLVNGGIYESLEYNYIRGIKRFDRPTYGTVVAQNDLARTLADYAIKLGLNAKETADLVVYGKKTLTAPYVFVSFFDQATSEQLLPLSFTPKPDNYLNIVFYFKQYSQKPNLTPVSPVFKPFLDRSGLTAVEISAMVE